MKTNNKFKNSVFTLLFSEPALLRELYCALDGVSLPPDAPVNINTLENALFMGQYNDISFEIGGKQVVLIEHQSTINPNMALRLRPKAFSGERVIYLAYAVLHFSSTRSPVRGRLLSVYIGRVYEKIVEGRSIYSEKPLKIPRPEFFVLYNGTDPFPDEKLYKLSEAFEELKSLGLSEKDSPALELTVRVININEGRNQNMVDRCKELSEYSAFVAKARACIKELGSREEGIRKAIIYCEKHGILREFLKAHALEVLSMLFTEFNLDDALAVRYEEGWEDGIEEGIEKGREEGLEEGRTSEKLEIARNLLAEGSSPEFVQKITGLNIDTIEGL